MVNIRNTDEEICKWCMRHQPRHSDRITLLKKIQDKWDYDATVVIADYTRIEHFEEVNKVCIYIKDIDAKHQIILSKQGNIDYMLNDAIYLLRTENEDKPPTSTSRRALTDST